MSNFFQELKRRNVFRVAAAYLVLAWVVLQITDLVAPALGLPDWTMTMVVFLGFVGFPFAIFFSWAFELTPEGLKRSEDVEPNQSITGHTASRLNQVTMAMLVMAVVILLLDRQLGLSSRWQPDFQTQEAEVAVQPDTPSPPDTGEAPSEDGPKSIAVLPFVNMSGDSEQEYFSDGISEELLNALAQIRELRVAARTSSFAFKGQNQDITHIGEQLNVETVLEGSVRKFGQRVRITAQLINVEDGFHLWSNTYDRDLVDIFAVQDEISGAIVDALKVHLTDEEAVAETESVDIAAYNLYLQARHNLRQRTRDSLELALRQYQQALDIDGQYAAAWAGRALATSLLRSSGYGDIPDQEATRLAQGYLDKAFAIDPDIAEGHAAQALVYQDSDRCPEAIASIELALTTMPSEGILYIWKNICLQRLGEYRAADKAVEKAYEIDPLHAAVRANWVNFKAWQGDFNAIRATTTPGTLNYYEAELVIARKEGRWGDMVLLSDGMAKAGGADAAKQPRAEVLFFWLGEPEQAEGVIQQHAIDLYRALKNPALAVESLAAVSPTELSPEQRHVLLVALSASGRFSEVVAAVDHLGLESLEDYGDFGSGDSAFENAIYLSWALLQQGETERARVLAHRLIDTVDKALARGLPYFEIGVKLSALRTVVGDQAAAVLSLRKLYDVNWLTPLVFTGFYPQFTALEPREDFQRLRAEVQAHLDSERQKLGWDAKRLEDI